MVPVDGGGQTLNPLESCSMSKLTRIDEMSGLKLGEIEISPDEASGERRISAKFLQKLIFIELKKLTMPVSIFRMKNLTIVEDLDLSGIKLDLAFHAVDCCFSGNLLLIDASFRSLHLGGSALKRIEATRLILTGSFDLRSSDDRKTTIVENGIELSGAKIGGNLDFRGALLKAGAQAKLGSDGRKEWVALRANGINVAGNILFKEEFRAEGELRLNNCEISRDIDMRGAISLSNPEGYAFSAAGSHIKGSCYFDLPPPKGEKKKRFIDGTIRLAGTTIGGRLQFANFQCIASDSCTMPNANRNVLSEKPESSGFEYQRYPYTIDAQGVTVGGDLDFDKLCSHGVVSLINATVKGDLTSKESGFDLPSGHAFIADGIKVLGTAYLEGVKTTGVVRFVQGELFCGLHLKTFTLQPKLIQKQNKETKYWPLFLNNKHGKMCGFSADRATIKGTFELTDTQLCRNQGAAPDVTLTTKNGPPQADLPRVPTRLCLDGATLSQINISQTNTGQSKAAADTKLLSAFERVHMTGCTYTDIKGIHHKPKRWIEMLDRHYIDKRLFQLSDDETFHPQPYLYYAQNLRASGYEREAIDVIKAMERHRTKYGKLGFKRVFGQLVLDGFLGYGFNKIRPITILLVWALMSNVVFQYAYQKGDLIPSVANVAVTHGPRKGLPVVEFNGVLFTVDTLLPLANFDQKRNWILRYNAVDEIITHKEKARKFRMDFFLNFKKEILFHYFALLYYSNLVIGSLLTTLFIAGLTGIIGKKY